MHGIPRKQGGYILILNIGVLALLLLGATYMGQQVDTAMSMARAEQAALRQEERLADARAKVMFMLATVARTPFGLGGKDAYVAPDGRYYRVDEHVAVSFQDVRGLVSLNSPDLEGSGRPILERLLSTYGLDADTSARLVDALLDYRDADNLRRINGAEEEEYKAVGKLHLLRNTNLKLPGELKQVLGWGEVEALWGEDPITRHVSVHPRSGINPNTASWRVLVALSGAAPELARDILQSRQREEIADITPLILPGAVIDPFSGGLRVNKWTSDELQVTLLAREGGRGFRFHVAHTPASEDGPWRIQYVERVSGGDALEKWSDLPPLPETGRLWDSAPPNQVQLPF